MTEGRHNVARFHYPILAERLRSLKFIRRVGVAFFLQVAGAGLAFAMQIALARWMGADGYGAYAYTIAWASLIAVASGLGLPTAMLRFVPSYLAGREWARLHGLLRASTMITLTVGIGASLILTLGIFLMHLAGGTVRPEIVLGLWLVPLIGLMTLQTETVRAFHRVILAFAPSLVLRPLLIILGGATCLVLGYRLSATTVLAITGISLLLLLTIQISLFWAGLNSSTKDAGPAYDLRHWLRVALPLLLISGFVILLMQTDIIMVGLLRGAREAGFYTAASKTASVVGLVLVAVNAIAAPTLSGLFASGEHNKMQELASTSAAMAFWPSLLLCILLAATGKLVLSLFGAQFSGSEPVLIVLLVGQLVNAAAGSVGYLMILTGHQDEAARVYGRVAAIHVFITPIAILAVGPLGAAIATSVSFAFWNLWLSILVVRRLNIHASVLSSFS
jgi:O-antigen/teichoic acid export membrane protein